MELNTAVCVGILEFNLIVEYILQPMAANLLNRKID